MEADDKLIAPDRRHERRQRVLKGALVVFGQRTRVFDCLVRNLSSEGAKLALDSTANVPEEFELLIQAEHRIAPVRTIWRTSREVGIIFDGPWRPYSHNG